MMGSPIEGLKLSETCIFRPHITSRTDRLLTHLMIRFQ